MAAEKTHCSFCRAPYYEGTGHRFEGGKYVFCGPCTHDFKDWLWRNTRRYWGKMSFYAHAFTPEVAVARRLQAAPPASPAGSP